MPRARAGGWREIQGRWDPADREECLRGAGGGVVGLIGAQVLVGMPSHCRNCLGSVWGAMVLTSGQVYSARLHARVVHNTHKGGHPFHRRPPDLPLWCLSLVPLGAVGWEPHPSQDGQAGCWLGSWWGMWVAVGQGLGKLP